MNEIRSMTFAVPLIDHGTSLCISTSDMGDDPVLLFCPDSDVPMVFNWKRGEYEPVEVVDPWQT